MLYATGMTEADMNKAEVGIASVWYEGNPCNMHLNILSEKVKEGVAAAGLVGLRFNTVGVSDGISMGTDGMSYSLQSRDLIADSIETVMGGQWYDGCIAIPGCDKNMPGCIMAMGRLNRPSLMIYGGTIKPGCLGDKKLDIISAFQSYGEYLAGKISDEERAAIVRRSCPARALRRDVHGKHDGFCDRGHGNDAPVQLLDAGRGTRQVGGMFPRGPGDPHASGKGHQAAATS